MSRSLPEEDNQMGDMPGSFDGSSRRAGKKRRGEDSSDETPHPLPTELQVPQSVLNLFRAGPTQIGPQPALPSLHLSSRTSKTVEERRVGKLKNDLRFKNISLTQMEGRYLALREGLGNTQAENNLLREGLSLHMSGYEETMGAHQQRIEQLEYSNQSAEEYMNRTIRARLTEMEAFMQQEKNRVVKELRSERDNAVHQAEAAYAARLDAMRAEATQCLEELRKEATEALESAKESADSAERNMNLAKQREVGTFAPSHGPGLKETIEGSVRKANRISYGEVGECRRAHRQVQLVIKIPQQMPTSQTPEPMVVQNTPDRHHRQATHDGPATSTDRVSPLEGSSRFPPPNRPNMAGKRMWNNIRQVRRPATPMTTRPILHVRVPIPDEHPTPQSESDSTTPRPNSRRSERPSEPVSSRRRGKRRAQPEPKSDSDTEQEGSSDTEFDNADDEKRPRRQRRKSTKSALAARVQRQRDALTKEEITKLNSKVRKLVKDVWDLSKDADIEFQEVACAADSQAYKDGTGEEPDTEVPRLYMRGSMSSEWNRAVCRSLLEIFKKEYMRKVAFASEELVLDTIVRKCTTLRNAWRKVQPRLHLDGRVETLDEVADRVQEDARESRKRTRQNNRRTTKYNNRVKLLTKTIQMKSSENAEDIGAWKWLQQLVTLLGVDGTSSDESDGEDEIYLTFKKKKMPWRRDVDKEFGFLDIQRLTDRQIWSNSGSKPTRRVISNLESTRAAVRNLPRELYDSRWLSGLTGEQQEALDIAETSFWWVELC
ncbi:hypothetical protein BDY19DRAFT_910854 [Irpex rosettiformis]|uniref:Uncharacterized protein n=1 Tax=Irpex rosettiformis TaxID=378272 RepID=A0ACB8TM96_9APHY|nr:hypothetical protein BDY19DRAFT_910854 [Irpex rosettiformis]